MPTSYRVRQEDFSNNAEVVGDYAVDLIRGRWRIYEQYSDYTSTTGGHLRRGKMVRRYDLDAGEQEGKPAQFKTKTEAIEYVNKYLTQPKRGATKA